jgi:hypothetical protein
MSNDAITWQEILTFLSPAGQQQLVDFIREAKETRGSNWLPEIKAEFPMFSWIVELIATRTAEEAFAELSAEFPNWPLWIAKGQLVQLHGRLAAEIDKPR